MFEKPISPGVQLLVFVCLYLFTWFLGGLIIAIYVLVSSETPTAEFDITEPKTLLFSVFVTQTVNFLFAFWLFLKFTGQKFSEVVALNRKFKTNSFFIVIAIFLLAMPAMWGLSIINEALRELMPTSALLDSEEVMNLAQKRLLEDSGVGRLLLTLLVIALLPAIAEKIIFRGLLMGRLITATGSVHFAVLISSLIFAGLHFQPLKLLPMVFLAMCLGYVYHYFKDLKYSMLLHFLINASQIVVFFFWGKSFD